MGESYLIHYGIKGQKWGVRRFQNEDGSYKSGAKGRYNPDNKLKIRDTDSKVTRAAKKDYANLSDEDFKKKYAASKKVYSKRVAKSKTGDPYAENPMVKKQIKKMTKQFNKEQSKIDALQKDIDSFNSIKNGVRDKKGREILTKDDVKQSVNSLLERQKASKQRIKEWTKQMDGARVVYNEATGSYDISLR